MSTPGPHWNVPVEVSLGTPQYLLLAAWAHNYYDESWFVELGDLLGGRPGWHCDLTHDGLLWSYGALGASLFSIAPPDSEDGFEPRFMLFDYEEDTPHGFADVDELRVRLEANESRHVDHARKLRGMAKVSDWGGLKTFGFVADVTVDGETWVATVKNLPGEATFGDSLATVVANLREMVGAAFDAPAAVIPNIDVMVRLDAKATAYLTG